MPLWKTSSERLQGQQLSDGIPVLVGGMLVKLHSYYLLLVDSRHGYEVMPNGFDLELGLYQEVQPERVSAVYELSSAKLRSSAIHHIITGKPGIEGYRVWPVGAREMTVDQVSEKLGYPIKIIGEQK